jgi:peptidoglycan/LPS O-acetylase OafA/YrhL
MTKPSKYLGILDLLRGFAALSVVCYHFTGTLTGGGSLAKFYSPLLDHAFGWGYLGVEVFFVISGFVIPYSLLKTSYTPRDFFFYFSKRIARICPPAYVLIGLTLLQLLVVDFILHHDAKGLAAVTGGQIVSNLLFIVPFTGHEWVNDAYWTLAIEFQFYVIIGLLFNTLFTKATVARFLVLGALLCGLNYLPGLPRENFFRYAGLFMQGGATLLYFTQAFSLRQYLPCLVIFTAAIGLMVTPLAAVAGLVTALAIAFVTFKHPVTAFFGRISYSLYLTHFLVGSTAEFVLSRVYRPVSNLGNSLAIVLCLILACVGAQVFYLLVEKPFLKWSKRLNSSPIPLT